VSRRGSWSALAAITAAIAAALAACAATTTPLPSPPPCAIIAPSPPLGAPMLWRVERPGAAVVWLYGTIHDAGAGDVPAVAWHQLDTASVFVSELGGGEPDPLQLRALARLPWGVVLDQLLPPTDWWDLVDAMLGAMTEDELRHARPWFALVRLRARTARAARPAMDAAMAAHAAARGIAVEPLESWRDQLAALDASVDAADLAQAIRDRRSAACQVARLHAAYRAGDLSVLTRMLVDPDAGSDQRPARGDPLLAERNRRWLPRIERHLERGGGFVAVGLGHLLGDAGLPAMLARAGYHVTRAAM
jgi:uncharacterized protein YbaP (TraB family)